MITTSYFASKKYNPANAMSIAIWAPRGYNGAKYPALYPPKFLLTAYKEGTVTIPQYIAIYNKEVLNKLDPAKVAAELEGKTLLCYEKSGTFCHRHLVAEWLQKHGYKVREL